VLNGTVGRTFTRPVTPVNIPATEAGTVAVAGTSLLADLTGDIAREFTAQFSQAQVENDARDAAGWQAFCTGAADVLQTTREATDEERALCEENGIEPHVIELGYDAVVFVAPEANDWLTCLNAGCLRRFSTGAAPRTARRSSPGTRSTLAGRDRAAAGRAPAEHRRDGFS